MISDTMRLEAIVGELPGLDCGQCGFRSCEEFARLIADNPAERKRCIHLDNATTVVQPVPAEARPFACGQSCENCHLGDVTDGLSWQDSLGREFDFILDTFPKEPGPRETILPHNPMLTREMDVKRGDILIGRPLGMSCGCPITHCGVVMNVEPRTGVIVWCVTGPLNPRLGPHKDIGYYIAEAYEGLVRNTQKELKIGLRYWFMPRRCMLQWRHSGLINFMSRTKDAVQIRIEGLFIG